MKTIEIDGKVETVWRCRVLVSWRLAGIFPFGGADWAESRRTGSLTAEQVPRDHLLEILLTAEVWLCATGATAVAGGEVVAMDTVAGTVTLKSGAVVLAKISRREHFAGEAQFVQGERLIAAMTHKKGGRKQPRTRTRTRRKGPNICGVCGWGHDAAFLRIAIPGRPVITLHGAMAQIVALVHAAQASGAGPVSTKDERLLALCGGYRHPCKVFDDLKRSADYKALFDRRRRGFVGLKMNAEARRTLRGAEGK
ncbi:MAG: hypothetical protein P4N60_13420 [Verrucomicrobiae bacterium]|nr:hypothetical protein [Verrucomicrobiae bacterium]